MWLASDWTPLTVQRVHGQLSFALSVTGPAHRTHRDAWLYHGVEGTTRRSQRPRGRLPQILLDMDDNARRSFMARRDQCTRADGLNAFQTSLHPPSWWEVAVVRSQQGLGGRYGPI
jgi:hypothetical protein